VDKGISRIITDGIMDCYIIQRVQEHKKLPHEDIFKNN